MRKDKLFQDLTACNVNAHLLNAGIRWIHTRGPEGRGVYSYDENGNGSLTFWGADGKAAVEDIRAFLNSLYIRQELSRL